MTQMICMWSGPRNLSTAMMRSFGSRSDTTVIDEPFFAPFLHQTGKDHPGRAETLEAHETDPVKVAAAVQNDSGTAYYFQKHMPHHMIDGVPMDWTAKGRHFILIRHPARVIASYVKGRADYTLDDLGYGPQDALHDRLIAEGHRVPIIDCDEILAQPEVMMRALCKSLDIDFDPAMLSWATGRRDTDGAWAPYWYKSVEASTGFGPARLSMPEIAPEHRAALDTCLPLYQKLYDKRIVARTIVDA